MHLRPPTSTRTDTLFPSTTLLRSFQMSIRGIQRTNGRAIRTAHLAYGRHAETNHIVFGPRRVALEIAMQAFIHARLVQLIVGLGEVVQAYIDITGFEQPPYGHQENLQTLFGGREVFGDRKRTRLNSSH